MIVLGADTHKRSHTNAAIAAGTGVLLGERTVAVGRRGFGTLLRWARSVVQERRLRELTLAINRLEREITELVAQIAPQLLTEPGFGPLIAVKLVGEIAPTLRDVRQARRAAGVAPIPALGQHTAPTTRPGRR